MIPDLDIYRAASVIIEQYGKDAQIHSTKCASAMLDKGDLDGYAVWRRALRAVREARKRTLSCYTAHQVSHNLIITSRNLGTRQIWYHAHFKIKKETTKP